MTQIKVDLLVKDEILYELYVRDVDCNEKSLVTELRKKLRKALSSKIQPNCKNLVNKISILNEFEVLTDKINQVG